MIELKTLVDYCNQLLEADRFRDYCPNGLQVEGRPHIGKLVSGVTASHAFLEAAIAAGADAVLVHHGYFWKGEAAELTGMKRRRVKSLLEHDISLLAYHLPLDAHPEVGNNAALARELGLTVDGVADQGSGRDILFYGKLPQPSAADTWAETIGRRLGRAPLIVGGRDQPIQSVAWCTGGAQGLIGEAVSLGVDAYLSGEISEPTTHIARESGIYYIAAGHHATERYGAPALGEHLAQHFGFEHQFIDVDNPA